MQWPNPSDYQDAVQNPRLCFFDPELQSGVVAPNALGLPRVASGNFASVYEVRSGGKRWAVRCFLRQNGDQQAHYEHVSQHLQGTWLSFMVGFEYQSKGIRVHGQTFPIVKMEWVEGETLPSFIDKHIHDAKLLLHLAAQWRGLVNSLQGNQLAHGDLQHGNILVTPQGQIKLVDYDAMYVPALHGAKCTELGHANYQHPQRSATDYDHHLDNFSALVIYLSLRALAVEPALWIHFHPGDNLIFTSQDFKAPLQSAVFQRLKRSSDNGVQAIAAHLAQCSQGTMAQMLSFEKVIIGRVSMPLPSAAAPPVIAARSSEQTSQWWTATPIVSQPAIPVAPIPSRLPDTPATVSTRINLKDGAEMILIPAGEFLMGSNDGKNDEKPQRKVYLDHYYIYKYPVIVAQYRKFCAATKHAMPSTPFWGWKESHPIVNVSWEDAEAYCKWAGGHLPTEAQWEKAARGTDGRKYSWGSTWDSSRLQCSSKSYGDAGSTAPVGNFPAGQSPYCVLDMAGNIWQWCADWYEVDYYKGATAHNPTGPASGKFRVLRGGSWHINAPDFFRATFRNGSNPASRFYIYGFRVVVS